VRTGRVDPPAFLKPGAFLGPEKRPTLARPEVDSDRRGRSSARERSWSRR